MVCCQPSLHQSIVAGSSFGGPFFGGTPCVCAFLGGVSVWGCQSPPQTHDTAPHAGPGLPGTQFGLSQVSTPTPPDPKTHSRQNTTHNLPNPKHNSKPTDRKQNQSDSNPQFKLIQKQFETPQGNICVYCPGGPDSDFEYSTQSYTGYEPTSMRAIRARYDPYVQVRRSRS